MNKLISYNPALENSHEEIEVTLETEVKIAPCGEERTASMKEHMEFFSEEVSTLEEMVEYFNACDYGVQVVK